MRGYYRNIYKLVFSLVIMSKKKGEKGKQVSFSKNIPTGVIVGIFVLALLLLSIQVPSSAEVTGSAVSSSFISEMFGDWSQGDLDVSVAKYFMFGILILLIFSIFNMTNIPSQQGVQWILSILVSFLAIAYITPEEIFTILSTYSALGMTLSIFVPFAVMLLFSAALLSPIKNTKKGEEVKLVPGKANVGQVVLVKFLWLLFTGFLLYKIVSGFASPDVDLSVGMSIVLGAVFIISLFLTIFNKKFRNWIRGIGFEIKKSEQEAIGLGVEGDKNIANKARTQPHNR